MKRVYKIKVLLFLLIISDFIINIVFWLCNLMGDIGKFGS